MRRDSQPLRALFVGAFLFFILLLLSYFNDGALDSQATYFASALRNVPATSVTIGGTAFSVDHGAVTSAGVPVGGSAAAPALRLAFERSLAERAPLLDLPGVDPVDLDRAADVLASTSQALASVQSNSGDAALVSDALYPVSFLHAEAALERARLSFLATGSDVDSKSYEDAELAAAAAYGDDLRAFRAAFATAVPDNAGSYATVRDMIGKNDALRAIDALSSGMSSTSAAIETRLACVRGDTGSCDASLLFPHLSAAEPATFSPRAVPLAEEIRGALQKTGVAIDQDAPLYLLASSDCVEAQPSTALLYISRPVPSPFGASYQAAYYVGDLRFVKTAPYASLPFYSYFARKHIPYTISGSLTYYECPETAYDQGALFAMKHLRSFAMDHPLSGFATSTPQLSVLEHLLATSMVVTASDAEHYLSDGLDLANAGALPEAEEQSVYTLAAEYRDKTPGIVLTALNIGSFEGTNLRTSGLGTHIDFSAQNLFFERSAFPSLYLAEDVDAMGPEAPIFPRNALTPAQEPFVYYSQLRADPAIRAELVRDLTFYENLHRD